MLRELKCSWPSTTLLSKKSNTPKQIDSFPFSFGKVHQIYCHMWATGFLNDWKSIDKNKICGITSNCSYLTYHHLLEIQELFYDLLSQIGNAQYYKPCQLAWYKGKYNKRCKLYKNEHNINMFLMPLLSLKWL